MDIECIMRSQVGRGGRTALELWLEFERNGLLAVLRQDGVDAMGIGR